MRGAVPAPPPWVAPWARHAWEAVLTNTHDALHAVVDSYCRERGATWRLVFLCCSDLQLRGRKQHYIEGYQVAGVVIAQDAKAVARVAREFPVRDDHVENYAPVVVPNFFANDKHLHPRAYQVHAVWREVVSVVPAFAPDAGVRFSAFQQFDERKIAASLVEIPYYDTARRRAMLCYLERVGVKGDLEWRHVDTDAHVPMPLHLASEHPAVLAQYRGWSDALLRPDPWLLQLLPPKAREAVRTRGVRHLAAVVKQRASGRVTYRPIVLCPAVWVPHEEEEPSPSPAAGAGAETTTTGTTTATASSMSPPPFFGSSSPTAAGPGTSRGQFYVLHAWGADGSSVNATSRELVDGVAGGQRSRSRGRASPSPSPAPVRGVRFGNARLDALTAPQQGGARAYTVVSPAIDTDEWQCHASYRDCAQDDGCVVKILPIQESWVLGLPRVRPPPKDREERHLPTSGLLLERNLNAEQLQAVVTAAEGTHRLIEWVLVRTLMAHGKQKLRQASQSTTASTEGSFAELRALRDPHQWLDVREYISAANDMQHLQNPQLQNLKYVWQKAQQRQGRRSEVCKCNLRVTSDDLRYRTTNEAGDEGAYVDFHLKELAGKVLMGTSAQFWVGLGRKVVMRARRERAWSTGDEDGLAAVNRAVRRVLCSPYSEEGKDIWRKNEAYGTFYHQACAQSLPKPAGDGGGVGEDADTSRVPCSICTVRGGGLQCTAPECTAVAHIFCAMLSKELLKNWHVSRETAASAFELRCPLHVDVGGRVSRGVGVRAAAARQEDGMDDALTCALYALDPRTNRYVPCSTRITDVDLASRVYVVVVRVPSDGEDDGVCEAEVLPNTGARDNRVACRVGYALWGRDAEGDAAAAVAPGYHSEVAEPCMQPPDPLEPPGVDIVDIGSAGLVYREGPTRYCVTVDLASAAAAGHSRGTASVDGAVALAELLADPCPPRRIRLECSAAGYHSCSVTIDVLRSYRPIGTPLGLAVDDARPPPQPLLRYLPAAPVDPAVHDGPDAHDAATLFGTLPPASQVLNLAHRYIYPVLTNIVRGRQLQVDARPAPNDLSAPAGTLARADDQLSQTTAAAGADVDDNSGDLLCLYGLGSRRHVLHELSAHAAFADNYVYIVECLNTADMAALCGRLLADVFNAPPTGDRPEGRLAALLGRYRAAEAAAFQESMDILEGQRRDIRNFVLEGGDAAMDWVPLAHHRERGVVEVAHAATAPRRSSDARFAAVHEAVGSSLTQSFEEFTAAAFEEGGALEGRAGDAGAGVDSDAAGDDTDAAVAGDVDMRAQEQEQKQQQQRINIEREVGAGPCEAAPAAAAAPEVPPGGPSGVAPTGTVENTAARTPRDASAVVDAHPSHPKLAIEREADVGMRDGAPTAPVQLPTAEPNSGADAAAAAAEATVAAAAAANGDGQATASAEVAAATEATTTVTVVDAKAAGDIAWAASSTPAHPAASGTHSDCTDAVAHAPAAAAAGTEGGSAGAGPEGEATTVDKDGVAHSAVPAHAGAVPATDDARAPAAAAVVDDAEVGARSGAAGAAVVAAAAAVVKGVASSTEASPAPAPTVTTLAMTPNTGANAACGDAATGNRGTDGGVEYKASATPARPTATPATDSLNLLAYTPSLAATGPCTPSLATPLTNTGHTGGGTTLGGASTVTRDTDAAVDTPLTLDGGSGAADPDRDLTSRLPYTPSLAATPPPTPSLVTPLTSTTADTTRTTGTAPSTEAASARRGGGGDDDAAAALAMHPPKRVRLAGPPGVWVAGHPLRDAVPAAGDALPVPSLAESTEAWLMGYAEGAEGPEADNDIPAAAATAIPRTRVASDLSDHLQRALFAGGAADDDADDRSGTALRDVWRDDAPLVASPAGRKRAYSSVMTQDDLFDAAAPALKRRKTLMAVHPQPAPPRGPAVADAADVPLPFQTLAELPATGTGTGGRRGKDAGAGAGIPAAPLDAVVYRQTVPANPPPLWFAGRRDAAAGDDSNSVLSARRLRLVLFLHDFDEAPRALLALLDAMCAAHPRAVRIACTVTSRQKLVAKLQTYRHLPYRVFHHISTHVPDPALRLRPLRKTKRQGAALTRAATAARGRKKGKRAGDAAKEASDQDDVVHVTTFKHVAQSTASQKVNGAMWTLVTLQAQVGAAAGGVPVPQLKQALDKLNIADNHEQLLHIYIDHGLVVRGVQDEQLLTTPLRSATAMAQVQQMLQEAVGKWYGWPMLTPDILRD